MNIIVMGHSHLTALQAGYELASASSGLDMRVTFHQLWPYKPFVETVNGDIAAYNSGMVRMVRALNDDIRPEAFVLSLIGAEHFIWAVQGQSRPFDIVVPAHSTLPRIRNAEIVPYELFRKFAYSAIHRILEFHRYLRAITEAPVIQVLPPPPIADQDALWNEAPEEFREIMVEFGCPDRTLRYKLWLTWVSIAKEIAGRDGIRVIGPPSEACGDGGFLRDAYRADAVHANDGYGRLVWLQLRTALFPEACREPASL